MKAKPGQIRSALAKPSPDIRFYLLHGPDEAGAAELAAMLSAAMGAGAERVDFDGAALRNDPARLADEAASLSLFGGARHIRVTSVGEESLAAVEALLVAERAGNPVVALAPTLRTTSKLVKLATESPRALVHGCYEPSADQAEQLATAMARAHGLQPADGIARRLAEAAGHDRAVIARELEKLACYLYAAPDRPQRLDAPALDAVGADLDEAETNRAVAAIVEGDPVAAAAELTGLAEPIPWLRALARRLVELAEMRAEIAAGQSPDSVVKRRRIHFSQERATLAALARWSPAMLGQGLARIRAAERAVMSPGNAGPVLADAAGVALARAIARR